MRKTKFFEPYDKNKKCTFNQRNKKGVYIIKKAGVVRYVGLSYNDLYKSMYRHFQEWNDKQQTRTTYKNLKDITIRVVYCSTNTQVMKLENALIHRYKPTDNPFTPDKLTDDKTKEIEKNYFQISEEAPF